MLLEYVGAVGKKRTMWNGSIAFGAISLWRLQKLATLRQLIYSCIVFSSKCIIVSQKI